MSSASALRRKTSVAPAVPRRAAGPAPAAPAAAAPTGRPAAGSAGHHAAGHRLLAGSGRAVNPARRDAGADRERQQAARRGQGQGRARPGRGAPHAGSFRGEKILTSSSIGMLPDSAAQAARVLMDLDRAIQEDGEGNLF